MSLSWGQTRPGGAEENPMILFIEKTWTLWWTFAFVVILYWLFEWFADTEPETLNGPVSDGESQLVSEQIPARRTEPPFVDGSWF
jgi:hypothetical protein